MFKVIFRFQSTAGYQRIGDADSGGVMELRTDVKGIIPL